MHFVYPAYASLFTTIGAFAKFHIKMLVEITITFSSFHLCYLHLILLDKFVSIKSLRKEWLSAWISVLADPIPFQIDASYD